MENTEILYLNGIRRFNLKDLNPIGGGKTAFLVGVAGSGKTHLAKEIILANQDIPSWLVINPTESRDDAYKTCVDPSHIRETLDDDLAKRFRENSKHEICSGLVLDDCYSDHQEGGSFSFFDWVYLVSRHNNNVLSITTSQEYTKVQLNHRQQMSHIFIFRDCGELHKIYQEIAVAKGSFPTLQDFENAVKICTTAKRCMVIDMTATGSLKDKVFWY